MPENSECEKVKTNIQKWLLEEGFKIQSQLNTKTLFDFLATDANGVKSRIIQPTLKLDQVMIVCGVSIDENQQSTLLAMENKKRLTFLWNLRFGLLDLGVQFSSITAPLKLLEISKSIYYDGLTKDAFMEKLLEVRNAVLFVFWTFDREFGEIKPKSDLMVR
jgi:hypothetical protein